MKMSHTISFRVTELVFASKLLQTLIMKGFAIKMGRCRLWFNKPITPILYDFSMTILIVEPISLSKHDLKYLLENEHNSLRSRILT